MQQGMLYLTRNVYCTLQKRGDNMTSASMQDAIDKILKDPLEKPTREEAKRNLQACGILDKNGNIAEAYKKIIVKSAT